MGEEAVKGRRAHHNLAAWQEAMELVKEVYQATTDFPPSESFGLSSQIRRAAVSVPSNIAEGAGREGAKEFLQFLSISRGSISELETQIILAKNLGYLANPDNLLTRIDRLFALIGGLMNSLRKRTTK
jgi:four helix bundle protein